MTNEFNEPWMADLRAGCCAIYQMGRREETNGCQFDDDRNIFYSHKDAVFTPGAKGGEWSMCTDTQKLYRHVVACVNACAGLTAEELEALGTGGVKKTLNSEA